MDVGRFVVGIVLVGISVYFRHLRRTDSGEGPWCRRSSWINGAAMWWVWALLGAWLVLLSFG